MDPASRRTYYNRCHPFDTLDPGDDRYVNIDAIDPEHPVRGDDWVTRLAGASSCPIGRSTSLRTRVRQAVAAHLPRFLDEAHDELRQLEQRAMDLGFRRLAVIFDSLEKLRGTSTNWDAVMESAERIFGSGASYLRLPVHVLYTIPTALIVRLRLDSVHFLPMIKLRQRDGARFEPSIDAAHMIGTCGGRRWRRRRSPMFYLRGDSWTRRCGSGGRRRCRCSSSSEMCDRRR
jgi:hypothetical protein